MHLAIPFTTLLMGSYVVAAPSIQHAQINVEISNIPDAYHDEIDGTPHSSKGPLRTNVDWLLKSLPYNFTLNARFPGGSETLPFGFANLDDRDGFVKGELGFSTEFALIGGKLINGNRALGYHTARIFPPWTSLWPLKNEGSEDSFFELVGVSEYEEDRQNVYLEFARGGLAFGALEIKHGQAVVVARYSQIYRARLVLAVQPIRKSSDDGTDAEAKELLL